MAQVIMEMYEVMGLEMEFILITYIILTKWTV